MCNSSNNYDENKPRNGKNKPSSVSPSPEGLMYNSSNHYDENKPRNGKNKPSSVSPSPEGLMYSILPTGTPQVDEIVIPSVETVFRQFLRDLFEYWSSLPEREKIKFCGEIYSCYSSHVWLACRLCFYY